MTMEPDEKDAVIAALQAALESFGKSMNELKKERDEARKEAEYWKDSLKLLGETPEQVFESWRIRHNKMFKYIRIMAAWREKYNISKIKHEDTKKEAEYYRERYEQLKNEREAAK